MTLTPHRDIKPENILLNRQGQVKLADFGIAKLAGKQDGSLALTMSGVAVGTPAYMSPEQLEQPSDVDHRADIYSLGVVFYEMLTGEVPRGRFAPPSQKTPVDERIDEIVLRALARERELRQQSAGEVKTQVQEVVSAPKTGAASKSGEPGSVVHADFVLCNPSLPRMAQAITVYGILAAPLLWALSLAALDFDQLPKQPYAGLIESARQFLGDVLGGVVSTLILLTGALKLRGLRTGAVAWLKSALWIRIGLAFAGFGLAFWAIALDTEEVTEVGRLPLGDAILGGVGLLAIGFEVSSLVWLRRKGHTLRALCSEPSTSDGEAKAHP